MPISTWTCSRSWSGWDGRRPGRRVGIRVNPRIGATHAGGDESTYAGAKPTKFGIYPERLDDAIEIARRHDLTIDTVHVHSGYLYFSPSLDVVDEIDRTHRLDRPGPCRTAAARSPRSTPAAAWACRSVPTTNRWTCSAGPASWPATSAHSGSRSATEPGEFIAKQTGVHLAEVVTVEDRDGTTFVGLDTGWNVLNEHFVYRIPFFPIVCRAADAEPVHRVTVSGHINEGPDLFAEDHPMPEVHEGDIVALPNVGSYNASMSSAHCLRGPAASIAFPDRA